MVAWQGTHLSLVGAQLPGLGMDNTVQVRWEESTAIHQETSCHPHRNIFVEPLLPQHLGEITEVHLLKSINYSEVLPLSKIIF